MTKKAKPKTKNEVPAAPDKQSSSAGGSQQGAPAQPPPPTAQPPEASATTQLHEENPPASQTVAPPSVAANPAQLPAAVEAKPQHRSPGAAGTSTQGQLPGSSPTAVAFSDHPQPPSDSQAKLPGGSHTKAISTAQPPATVNAKPANGSTITTAQLPVAVQAKSTGGSHTVTFNTAMLPKGSPTSDIATSQPSIVTQSNALEGSPIVAAIIAPSHPDAKASEQNIAALEASVAAVLPPVIKEDLSGSVTGLLPPLVPVNTPVQDKVPENAPPHIVSAVVKQALIEQPAKKPAGKQNKREKATKQPVTPKSDVADKTPASKSSETEAAKDKAVVPETLLSQLKEEPKEQTVKKLPQTNAEIPPSGLAGSTAKPIATTAEKLPAAEKAQDTKYSKAETKIVGKKSVADPTTNESALQPTEAKTPLKKENDKKVPAKKVKQKSEQAPNSRKMKSADTGSVTENGKQCTAETNRIVIGDSEKPSLTQFPHKTVKPLELETTVSESSAQSKQENNKVKQHTKTPQELQETKTFPAKDDQQSKSTSKKKNKQQPKSSSEEVKPAEKKDNKVVQESTKPKNNENNKPVTGSTSERHKTSALATSTKTETTDLGKIPGETVLKTGSAKAQSPAKDLTAPKHEGNEQAPAEEQESGSKKKKRNRHKKKNKAGDDEKVNGNVTCVEAKMPDANRDSKVKEKSATKASQEKVHQKDGQLAQSNKKKAKQPSPATAQNEESLKKEGTSEDASQMAASKKCKHRKKKAAEKESEARDGEETKPETSVTKPNHQDEASEPVPLAGAEDVQKKKNDSKAKSKQENEDKQTENQAIVADSGNVEGEDQQEKFVEVKSKSKRNKKNRQNGTEVQGDVPCKSSIFSDISNSNPQATLQWTISDKENIEKGAATDDKAKVVGNKVAAPKLSPEAKEQKMLKKKLAERAQQKIQQQIESNCLSEAEKSEKYLETITKNLKELTKLRSSKLEEILQKSAADGEEEFDYEYSPVQRSTFLATTCHVCKESKPKENLRSCNLCHMISYCSEEHQKSDWAAHKGLCQAVTEICKERGTNNLFAPATGLTADEYRAYRMNVLIECSAILNRQLDPYEQEMILYPNICQTCHLPAPAKLQTCDRCELASYCSPEHRQPNHDVWCPDLQLFKSLIVYQSRNGVINPQLPEHYPETTHPPLSDMQSLLQAVLAGKDVSLLERAAISEIATGPLTTLFALYKANKISESTETLVVHFVGAEWSFELERADKWEAFLLHLIPNVKSLVLVFVGPEVASLPEEARKLLQKQSTVCLRCQERGCRVDLSVASQLFYHEYAASANYVKPDVICAFNAGLYRPNGYKEVDSWADTLGVLLKDPDVPLAVTSYTAEEMLKDVDRLKQRGPLNFILTPSQNPYRSLRPNRNFASDDATPVIFKNFYITIAASIVY